MATGGAWQSETFDVGQKTWPAEVPPSMQQPTAAAPPQIYNPPAGSHRESASIGTITLALRFLQFLFSFIALAVMASNKGGVYDDGFTYVPAYIGVVAMNAIVCVYAVVQVVLSVVNRSAVGSFASFPTTSNAILSFVFDTILAYTLMGVSGAAAEIVAPSYKGLDHCVAYSKFCQKAAAAVAMSIFAWAALAAVSALYTVRLLRLIKR